jgi:hypothetical protein
MGHTYNRVTEKYGDEIGLAYENLVEKIILGEPHDVELIILTGDVATNGKRPKSITSDTYDLLCAAREHAQQEIDYSAKHQPIKRETPDMEISNIYQELNTVRLLNTYSTMREAKELLRELFIDCPIHDLSKEASYRELYITCVTSRTKDDFNARLGKLELHLFDCINH